MKLKLEPITAKTQTAFIDEYNAPAGLANLGLLFYVNALRKPSAPSVAVHGIHNRVGGPFARYTRRTPENLRR